jgi:polar amino acid transport system substrate-binding protein
MKTIGMILSVCLLLVSVGVTAQADHIILAADAWCPITCEPGSERPGYMIEIAQLIFARAGHTVEYQMLPWARAIKDARDGKITGIVGAFAQDAPDFILPENPQGLLGNELFVKKGQTWRYAGIDSLRQIVLGAITDYAYGDDLDAYIAANKADLKHVQLASGENPLEVNIKKLQRGRIDALVESAPVFWYTVNQMGLAVEFLLAGQIGEPQKTYISFSPANPAAQNYARILSDGMTALRASGELAPLLQKYHLTDWQP